MGEQTREARAAWPLGMGASLSMSASLCASGKGGGGAGTHALAIKGGGRLVRDVAERLEVGGGRTTSCTDHDVS